MDECGSGVPSIKVHAIDGVGGRPSSECMLLMERGGIGASSTALTSGDFCTFGRHVNLTGVTTP